MSSSSTVVESIVPAAAAAAAVAEPAVAAAAVVVTFPPGKELFVSDARALLAATYPKLCSRFSYAFQGHDDSAPLAAAVDAISSDVFAWLQAMPENFKTSSHALSRPKFGLLFVLKHDGVRAALGADRCASAIDAVEGAWEECKKALITAKEEPAQAGGPASAAEGGDQSAKHELVTAALVALIAKHYDGAIAALVEALINNKV